MEKSDIQRLKGWLALLDLRCPIINKIPEEDRDEEKCITCPLYERCGIFYGSYAEMQDWANVYTR